MPNVEFDGEGGEEAHNSQNVELGGSRFTANSDSVSEEDLNLLNGELAKLREHSTFVDEERKAIKRFGKIIYKAVRNGGGDSQGLNGLVKVDLDTTDLLYIVDGYWVEEKIADYTQSNDWNPPSRSMIHAWSRRSKYQIPRIIVHEVVHNSRSNFKNIGNDHMKIIRITNEILSTTGGGGRPRSNTGYEYVELD